MASYNLFTRDSQAFIYGLQKAPCQRMLDFDYMCSRDTPSVAAFIDPGRSGFEKAFFGVKEILIPVYPTIGVAAQKHPNVDVLINFASMRSAFKSSVEALETTQMRTLIIIAEGIPENQTRQLIAMAKNKNKVIIGPATVGGILAGSFRIGNTGGTIESMIEAKLHRRGLIGLVAKSGGMSNEMFKVIALHADGIHEGIAIGGDRYPGSRLIDHILRFEQNPEIKMHVVLGEVGGDEEYLIVEALRTKKIKKPLVAWVMGTCSAIFPTEAQFGHAGAKAGSFKESAQAKNEALKEAGAFVPNSYDDLGEVIEKVYRKLKKAGKIKVNKEIEPRPLPQDFEVAYKKGQIRKATHFICSISDERGEEVKYGPYFISEIIEKGFSLGEVISILWFKKRLPAYGHAFLELILKITADHGPCVSGAHNAIVAAGAGKDLVSALVSGLLTIGPRFGGAIDGAALYFKDAFDRGLKAADFVKEMKEKNIPIPGIGHLVKSIKNPDKRVELLKNFAKKNFKQSALLDYGLEVEKITTQKKENLILNVDGCIAVLFIDLMRGCGLFSKEEVDEVIENGALNGLFVLGRSIGLIGHILDQKRYKQRLYRHPWDDVMFADFRE